MKKISIIFFLALTNQMLAQSEDFNTKKGFAVAGYDVVSYFDDNPQKGSMEIVLTHNEVKYSFVNAENKERFLVNPDKYIPQYGGYCAYAMAVSAKKVSVNPETFEIRDSKLYLFYNAGKTNTLESWLQESPEELRLKADNNWDKLKILRR